MTKKKDRDDLTSISDLGDFDHTEEALDELFESPPEEDPKETDALNDLEEAFSAAEDEELDFSDDSEDDELPNFKEEEKTSADLNFSDDEIENLSYDEDKTNITSLHKISSDSTSRIEPSDDDLEFPSGDFIVEEIVPNQALKEKYADDKPLAQELHEELSREMAAHIPNSIAMEHIPSFSLKITGIKNKFDGEDVLRIMREFLKYSEDEENLWIRAIERGEVLVPRIGEFVAITIAHKLRHIDATFQLGLSEEIFDTPVDEIQKGPVNHHTLSLNKTYSYDVENSRVPIKEVLTTTTPHIENAQIKDYLGIVMEEKTIDITEYNSNIIELNTLDDKSREFEQFGFKEVYRELTDRLKHHAMNKSANGVINIQFQNIPFPKNENLYKIICSGTLVWIEKR